jgi:hypothetical protein
MGIIAMSSMKVHLPWYVCCWKAMNATANHLRPLFGKAFFGSPHRAGDYKTSKSLMAKLLRVSDQYREGPSFEESVNLAATALLTTSLEFMSIEQRYKVINVCQRAGSAMHYQVVSQFLIFLQFTSSQGSSLIPERSLKVGQPDWGSWRRLSLPKRGDTRT